MGGTVVDDDTLLFPLPLPATHAGNVFYDIWDEYPTITPTVTSTRTPTPAHSLALLIVLRT